MIKRKAVTKECFLIVEEDGSGDNWRLKVVAGCDTKEEAFERVEGGVLLDGNERYVIPCYRGDIDWEHDALPPEFKDVEPKGELPNPVTQAQADGSAE